MNMQSTINNKHTSEVSHLLENHNHCLLTVYLSSFLMHPNSATSSPWSLLLKYFCLKCGILIELLHVLGNQSICSLASVVFKLHPIILFTWSFNCQHLAIPFTDLLGRWLWFHDIWMCTAMKSIIKLFFY